MSDQWKGVTVENGQVRSTIKRYGSPEHSKPHGPDKTILYYPDPEATAADETPVVDYAGTVTPGGREMVVHQPTGAGVAGSSITGQVVVAGASPHVGLGTANLYANPNDRTRDSEIINPEALDPEILEQEKKALENREKAGDKGTTVQDSRPRANHRFFGGAAPWVGATPDARFGATTTGAAEIPFLDRTQMTDLRKAVEAGDTEAIDFVLNMVPALSGPAPSDAGSDKFSELSTNESGEESNVSPSESAVEMTPEITERSEADASLPPADTLEQPGEAPSEEERPGLVSRVVEKVKDVTEQLTREATPEEKLRDAHPEWTFAFLDQKTKAELEELAESVKDLGIAVERTDGKDESLRKTDYVAALRIDK
jgi:hypothetical protein